MELPIRILHVVTNMDRGGLETMLMNYYRHIDHKKVQFDFLVHRNAPGAYDSEIDSLGGRIYHLPRLNPWNPTYYRTLRSFFRAHKEYKIVHVHQDCLSSIILRVAKQEHVPVRIAHSHNSSQDKNFKYPIKLFYRQWIPCYATALFACGGRAGQWMFHGAPFQILNNAIDTSVYQFDPNERLRIRAELDISPDTLLLGHVGRFWYPKNHSFLIDLFASFHQTQPNSRLLLVGDGSLRPPIEEKVLSLGLTSAVIFAGLRDDVPNLLQAMDVFMLPSIYEGTSVSTIEAQAAGLPCIISSQIPTDCDITSLITRVSLDAPITQWNQSILNAINIPRKDHHLEVAAAGFDITENALKLQSYYLKQWEEAL